MKDKIGELLYSSRMLFTFVRRVLFFVSKIGGPGFQPSPGVFTKEFARDIAKVICGKAEVISLDIDVEAKRYIKLLAVVTSADMEFFHGLHQDTLETMMRLLNHAFKTIPWSEREVIQMLYGIKDGRYYSVKEVASVMQKSPRHVRTKEASAIHKLQTPSRSGEIVQILKKRFAMFPVPARYMEQDPPKPKKKK